MGQIREAEIMDVEQDIRAVLDALERAYFDGTDPCTILGLMYEDDVIVVGEGDVSATRGIQGLEEQARAISASAGPHPQVSFTIVSPILACADAAMTMIGVVICRTQVRCTAGYSPDGGRARTAGESVWRCMPRGSCDRCQGL
jgi:hypothetical protein